MNTKEKIDVACEIVQAVCVAIATRQYININLSEADIHIRVVPNTLTLWGTELGNGQKVSLRVAFKAACHIREKHIEARRSALKKQAGL